MKRTKIVVIGAGSASFGLTNLGAILRTPELHGSELRLVDLNEQGLESILQLAKRINEEWGSGFVISGSTERREHLPEADFVVLSIAVDREKCWRLDHEIAKRHGIMHYAENGGPGALMHTARNLAIVMPILRDMEQLCPDAWLLNFTNPVPRICIAVARYTKIKAVGICHQIGFGYMMAGNILRRELGIPVPPDYVFRWDRIFAGVDEYGSIKKHAEEKLDILAAGINHFTWMLSIRDQRTGEDLYPLLRERIKTHNPAFEPLTKEVFALFGLFPVPGDCHLVEYLPYTHNMQRDTWGKYEIQMYPLDETADRDRDRMWRNIQEMAAGRQPVDGLRGVATERAELIMAAIAGNKRTYEQALNIPNRGYISNLPEGAIVEVPGVVDATGIKGVGVGPLPGPIAELCRRQVTVAELAVEAGVKGDRGLALQALALDPLIDDPGVARMLLDDYLKAQVQYLPQFFKK